MFKSRSTYLQNYDYGYLVIATLMIMPIILFSLASPNDTAGWILLLLSYIVLLTISELRKNKTLFVVAVTILTLHHSVTFMNAYIGLTIGSDIDAYHFYENAGTLASIGAKFEFSIGSGFYTHVLAVLYKMFGTSLFFGGMTSGLAFVFVIRIFVKLMKLMNIGRHQAKILFLFGALPTMVFNTTITLRESWEVLFLLMAVYYALLLHQKKKLSRFLALLASVSMLAILHNGLMAFVPVVIILSFWYVFSKRENQRGGFIPRMIITLLASGIVLGAWVISTKSGFSSSATNALTNGGLIEYASGYRDGSNFDSRASYGVVLTDPSLMGLIKTIPLMFFYYMFAPLPWQISSVKDIYAAGESLLRFILLYYAFICWKRAAGEERRKSGYLLLVLLSLEMLWSLGTINWGTALRHHLMGYGLLLLAGGQMMFDKLNVKIRL